MRDKYHTTRTVEILIDGNSVELEAAIEYTVAPFIPEKGTSYASGGQPSEGGHVEDIWCKGIKFVKQAADVSIDCPEWLEDVIVQNIDGESLYAEALDGDKAADDWDADFRRERAREDREYFAAHPIED